MVSFKKKKKKKKKKKLFVYCTLHNGFIQFPSVIFYLMLHVLFNYHVHTIHQRSLILTIKYVNSIMFKFNSDTVDGWNDNHKLWKLKFTINYYYIFKT